MILFQLICFNNSKFYNGNTIEGPQDVVNVNVTTFVSMYLWYH